ncbi:unnamed protein product [Aphanomyces euteiches]
MSIDNARGLLESLSVQITKAVVSTIRLPTTYTLEVANTLTGTTVVVTKTDRDFKAFTDDLRRALRPGHACSSLCPWFYVAIRQKIPKRQLFFPSRRRSVVATHVKQYKELLDAVVAFVQLPQNWSCTVAVSHIPAVYLTFLLGNEKDVDPNMLASSKTRRSSIAGPRLSGQTRSESPSSPSSSWSSGSSGRLRTLNRKLSSEDSDCTVCSQPLVDVASEQDLDGFGGLSLLQCGHVFHDECILDALNKQLVCPTCGTPCQ